ncbi:MAG: asparagine synthase (glutamine-hydrolyzing) [Candidatus Electrothrix sp. GM3_4]|nr:asparagine synthase (glutamine-hydrolyzing) [Candidatus Electrothrix sp. GM3_4]
MCGIAGILCPENTNSEQLRNIAVRMIATLPHRGPDDNVTSVENESGLALSHCRLAIQDLSPLGAQPMNSASGRYLLSFNGEIYNFRSLRKDLLNTGSYFKGGSDTEVMLAAIEAWGLNKALRRFSGMFAFALWDRQGNKLHLCRDRLGEKPLYYGFVQHKFVFASELKALKVVEDWGGEIDREALTLFMRYGYIPAPFSIYKNIYKLIPGTLLTVSSDFHATNCMFSKFVEPVFADTIQPVKYWSLADVVKKGADNLIADESSALLEFENLFSNVVADQMVADVPVGAFLSGGIDSSLVAAFMQKGSSRSIKTFTIGYDNADFNEAGYALEIAKFLGTEHTEVYLSPQDTLALIPQLPTIYDEPHADSSQLPAYLVSKIARQSVTVCLSGDGGDELFAGYNRYLKLEEVWRRSQMLPVDLRNIISKLLLVVPPSGWDRIYRFVCILTARKNGRETSVGLKIQKLATILSKNSMADMYKELLSYWDAPEAVVLQGHESDHVFGRENELGTGFGFINQALYWDSLSYLPDDNLCKVDRASMAVSLETRLPLLDPRIVEFSWRLPIHMKVRDGESKWLLRQVLYKNIDKKLLDRPKMGFSVPIADWLREPLLEWGNDLLSEKKLKEDGFFDVALVRRKWDEHISGRRNWHLALWAVLTFQAWYAKE